MSNLLRQTLLWKIEVFESPPDVVAARRGSYVVAPVAVLREDCFDGAARLLRSCGETGEELEGDEKTCFPAFEAKGRDIEEGETRVC